MNAHIMRGLDLFDVNPQTRDQTGQHFLIRKKGIKNKAHYWDGKDTVCRMASTGGMARVSERYYICDNADGHDVCTMCSSVAGKRKWWGPRHSNP